jgi:DNA-binding response OmpR family regulator
VLPRVLIVDDEANQARRMATGLELEGFDVETAPDSGQALALLASGSFDLAVVDLMMPGTNGIQLARQLRERHLRTCVVLTSAYHLSEPQLLHADCGAVGFVPKPVDVIELASFLRAKLLSARAARGSGAAA